MRTSVADASTQKNFYQKKNKALQWFEELKIRLCTALEEIEKECHLENSETKAPKFKTTLWKKDTGRYGGGSLELLKGQIFEKAVAHNSNVYGEIPNITPEGQSYWNASFFSTIYPRNPHIPALSAQFYMVATDYIWFGFGIEMIPMLAVRRQMKDPDVFRFQKSLKFVCDKYMPSLNYDYSIRAAKKNFLISHRGIQRGCGGIFCEQIFTKEEEGGWDKDLSLIKDLGKTICLAYPHFVRTNLHKKWNDEEKLEQLLFRGLCAEYTLLCDSYIRFSLDNDLNASSILSVLPPVCHWG